MDKDTLLSSQTIDFHYNRSKEIGKNDNTNNINKRKFSISNQLTY